MHRAAIITVGILGLTASAAWAAITSMPMDDLVVPEPSQDVIVIHVAPEDLERCRMTLADVMSMPVDPAFVTAVDVDMPEAPQVRCEVQPEEMASR